MRVSYFVAAGVLALGLAQAAYANHGGDGKSCERHKHSFMEKDTNKDGAVSKDEFMASHQARADEMFAKMDANNDGKIDQAERDAMKAKWKEHHKNHEMKHGAEPK